MHDPQSNLEYREYIPVSTGVGQTQGVPHMKLTKKQSEKLKKLDIVKAAREARAESAHLLNDQGFAVLSIALSHIISDIAEHPEKLVKEFAH